MSTAALPDVLGEALARATADTYDILGLLGRGGMAAVYLAHDKALDRRVAIKVLAPDLLAANPASADRFVLEARVAASLAHPHIIPIYSVRHVDGLHFFAMQFVDGWPLDVILHERGALPPAAVRCLISQAAQALGHAHRKGVIHRDVKPGNIMIDSDGRAVVLDFGIAKVAQAATMTQTGTAIGTPTYMSPEQCRGQVATTASDQYALGMVAFELLAGFPAFASETTFGLIYSHVQEAPPRLRDVCPECPIDLAEAIARMIEKDPKRRWPSLDDFADAIGLPRFSDQAAVRDLLFPVIAGHVALPSHAITGSVPTLPAVPTLPTVPVVVPEAAPRAAAEVPTPVPAAPPAAPAPVAAAPAAAAPVAPPSRAPVPAPAPPPASAPRGPNTLEIALKRGTLSLGQSFPLGTLLAAPVEMLGDLAWRSTDPTVVRVGSDGRATAENTGTVDVFVSDGHLEARTRLDVTRATVVSLTLKAPSPGLAVGDHMQLEATPLDGLGMRQERRLLEWRTSAPAVATVSPTGFVEARAPGYVTITAACGAQEASVTLKVGPEQVTGVLVLPRALLIVPGERAALTAYALTARGRTRSGYRPVWTSSNPGIVEVTADGAVTGIREGSARIYAMLGECRGIVPVEVRLIGD